MCVHAESSHRAAGVLCGYHYTLNTAGSVARRRRENFEISHLQNTVLLAKTTFLECFRNVVRAIMNKKPQKISAFGRKETAGSQNRRVLDFSEKTAGFYPAVPAVTAG